MKYLGGAAAILILSLGLYAAPVAAQSDARLEEIVVTAQKREQSLQDVGIAITAFSGDVLDDMGVDSLRQIQDHTPNLRIKGTITGVAQYAIRGVGENSDTSALSSSPVGVHVNQVAQPFPVAVTNLLFDLERVEVLRGPQGDLFGLNTTAGTINYVTRLPGEEFEASIRAEFGNYDRTRITGILNAPLSETFGIRLAASQNKRNEGWQVNEATGEKLGEFDKSGVRLSAGFAPSENFSADFEVHASKDDSDATGFRNLANFFALDPVPTILGDPNFLLQSSPVSAWNGTGWTSYTRGAEMETIGLVNTDLFPAGTKPFVDNEGTGGSLVLNWNFDTVNFTSVTGFENFERRELNDSDGDEIQDSNQFFQSDLDLWSQEFRLASNGDNAVDWVLGANAASDELTQLTMFVQPDQIDFPGVGGQNPRQERDIWAVFGHVDWAFNDRWELVAGLRFTSEERSQQNVSTFKMGMPTDIVELLSGGVFAPDPNDPFALGTPLTDADFSCFVVALPCAPGSVGSDKISNEEWSGKIGLNYSVSDNWMLYGSFSRGFKSGGFLDTAASSSASFVNSKPEFLNAWEFGSKAGFADGKGRLNAAVFFYDYEDQQIADSIVDPLFGPLGVIVNAPKTEIYGGEIEFAYVTDGGFEVLQNLGYSKGEFEEFIGVDADASRTNFDPVTGFFLPVFVDRAGESLEMPELQYSGTLAYTADFSNGLSSRFVVDYSFEDKVDSGSRTWTDELTGDVSKFDLPSYWLVNARISLMNNDSWEVTVFGDNLLDEEYLLQYTRFNRGVVQVVGMPRTYGLRLSYTFN